MANSGIAVDWEMLVSGASQIDGTSCDWTLYGSRVPETETETLQIDCLRQAQDDREILYQNILVGSTSAGDSPQYSVHGDTARVRLVDVSKETTKRVEWNLENGSGQFIGPDGECCWGDAPNFPDIDCQ